MAPSPESRGRTTAEDRTMVVADKAGRGTHGPIERVVPGGSGGEYYFEHLGRYEFASQFVQGKEVLDLACGTGYAAPILIAAGATSYRGVDISAEAVAIAESRYKLTESIAFMLGDACKLDSIGDGTIDVAISFETIEHLADPRRFLAELRRVLVPGGTLVMSTPNRTLSNPEGNLNSTPTNPFHIREWNTREFTQLLRDFFTVEKALGQGPRLFLYKYWVALVLRHATEHESLQWLVGKYRGARCLWRGPTSCGPPNNGHVPVQPIRPWQCPTYIVCVCRRPVASPSGRKTSP